MTLSLKLRTLPETPAGSGKYVHVVKDAGWTVDRTAAIICDVWDDHWCHGAARRVTEMAPQHPEIQIARGEPIGDQLLGGAPFRFREDQRNALPVP